MGVTVGLGGSSGCRVGLGVSVGFSAWVGSGVFVGSPSGLGGFRGARQSPVVSFLLTVVRYRTTGHECGSASVIINVMISA